MRITSVSNIEFKLSPARIISIERKKGNVVLGLRDGRELTIKEEKNFILDEVSNYYEDLWSRGLYDTPNPLKRVKREAENQCAV